MQKSFFRLAAAGIALVASTPAFAQAEAAPEDSIFDGNYLTVGGGVGYGPSYEGSNDYVIFPAAAIQGKLFGVEISPRPAGFALDFIHDPEDPKVGFSLGPVVRARFDRTGNLKDPVVKTLGKRNTAIEVGVNAGVTAYKLLSDYDSLTLSSDIRWDVAGAHKGRVIQPSLTYVTPVSRGAAVVLSATAENVDNNYADYYFTIRPADTLASGLPTYKAAGGWKNVGLNLLSAIDLDGNLLNGGFALYAGGGYSRLLEDAKRSPVTSIRGDPNQWFAAIGIGYTF